MFPSPRAAYQSIPRHMAETNIYFAHKSPFWQGSMGTACLCPFAVIWRSLQAGGWNHLKLIHSYVWARGWEDTHSWDPPLTSARSLHMVALRWKLRDTKILSCQLKAPKVCVLRERAQGKILPLLLPWELHSITSSMFCSIESSH